MWEAWGTRQDHTSCWEVINEWKAQYKGQYPTGEGIEDVFWRTLLLDCIQDNRIETSEGGFFRNLFLSVFDESEDDIHQVFLPGNGRHSIPFTPKAIKQIFYNAVVGGDFIYMGTGYVGIVSDGCGIGDYIYAIQGYQVPLVLRCSIGSPSNTFTLVGPAYVHGIMDG
jgi:hypothetical protein